MNLPMSSGRPGRAPIAVAVALAAVAAGTVAVPSVRQPGLRAAGWALVVTEPVAPADAIVVSPDSGGAGALEVADPVANGMRDRRSAFAGPPTRADPPCMRPG